MLPLYMSFLEEDSEKKLFEKIYNSYRKQIFVLKNIFYSIRRLILMKKKRLIVMAFISSCLLNGCHVQNNDVSNIKNQVISTPVPTTTKMPVNEYNNIQIVTELSMDIEVINISNQGMDIFIENTNEDNTIYTVLSGCDVIEQQIAGDWKQLEVIYDLPQYDTVYSLRPRDTLDYYAYWVYEYEALPPGDYRLTITVDVGLNMQEFEYEYIYIYFTL